MATTTRATRWRNRAPQWKKRLQHWNRYKSWYLSMPVARLLHGVSGFSLRSKESFYREARAAFGRVAFDPGALPRLSTSELCAVAGRYAPPQIPFDLAVVRTADLRGRFGHTAKKTYSPMLSRFQATYNDLPGKTAIVLVMFSDVVTDYYNEGVAERLCDHVNARAGQGVAVQDLALVRLKEVAVAAGLGRVGKNALFFSEKFGFHCKISVIASHAEFDDYTTFYRGPAGPAALQPDGTWKLPACTECNLCVSACPVGAYDDFKMLKPIACERVISRDFFGHRRNHTCRACITSCPESTALLKSVREAGVPRNKFWDHDRQINATGDILYRPSFLEWAMQRFYYGAGVPGTERAKGRALPGRQLGREGVPHAASEANNGWVSFVRSRLQEGGAAPAPDADDSKGREEKA